MGSTASEVLKDSLNSWWDLIDVLGRELGRTTSYPRLLTISDPADDATVVVGIPSGHVRSFFIEWKIEAAKDPAYAARLGMDCRRPRNSLFGYESAKSLAVVARIIAIGAQYVARLNIQTLEVHCIPLTASLSQHELIATVNGSHGMAASQHKTTRPDAAPTNLTSDHQSEINWLQMRPPYGTGPNSLPSQPSMPTNTTHSEATASTTSHLQPEESLTSRKMKQ